MKNKFVINSISEAPPPFYIKLIYRYLYALLRVNTNNNFVSYTVDIFYASSQSISLEFFIIIHDWNVVSMVQLGIIMRKHIGIGFNIIKNKELYMLIWIGMKLVNISGISICISVYLIFRYQYRYEYDPTRPYRYEYDPTRPYRYRNDPFRPYKYSFGCIGRTLIYSCVKY